jgi:phage baseplate assembly protein V
MDELTAELLVVVQDLQRRVNNLLRPGRIIAVDPKAETVRVRLSDGDGSEGSLPLDTPWITVMQERAGETSSWEFPEIGEQVMVLSPGGELSGGMVGHAIHYADRPSPSTDPKVKIHRFSDGFAFSYDQTTHTLLISRPSELSIVIDADKLQVTAKTIEFQTEKAAIRNAAGDEFLGLTSAAFKSVQSSQTATMMGPQPLLPAANELQGMTTKMDSFGG